MRDRLKDAAYWESAVIKNEKDLDHFGKSLAAKVEQNDPKAGTGAWALFMSLFKIVLLDYSVGKPMAEVAAKARELLGHVFPDYLAAHPPGDPLCITRPAIDRINRFFALLVLCRPSHDEAAAFGRSYDLWDYRQAPVSGQRDRICEAMLEYLGLGAGRAPATGVNWPEAYLPLWQAIDPATPDTKRVGHLVRFLEGWYPVMAAEMAAQTETHSQKNPNYVGYWCLEAAAAVVICGIDDSTFRDHPHYPADFADWARGA